MSVLKSNDICVFIYFIDEMRRTETGGNKKMCYHKTYFCPMNRCQKIEADESLELSPHA